MAFDQALSETSGRSDDVDCKETKRRLKAVKLCVSEGHTLDAAARRLRLSTSGLRKWLQAAAPDVYAEASRPYGANDGLTETQQNALSACKDKGLSFAQTASKMNAKFGLALNRDHVRYQFRKLGQVSANRPGGAWSDETVARLKELVKSGHSATEAASLLNKEFDLDLSRSAVIGKAGRSGLSFGSGSSRPGVSRPRRRKPQPKKPQILDVDLDAAVSLMDLQSHHCRWPVSIDGPDPAEPRLERFCGQKAMSGSYCDAHAARVHQPAGAV